jgi:hypothetical protein
MSWQDAHRYNQALRAAAADLTETDGVIIWRPEFDAIFGNEDELLLALRSRWQTTLHAQIEQPVDPDGRLSDAARHLAEAHRGVLRALACAARSAAAQRAEQDAIPNAAPTTLVGAA